MNLALSGSIFCNTAWGTQWNGNNPFLPPDTQNCVAEGLFILDSENLKNAQTSQEEC